ncbi:MAG: hypothetical protein ACK4FB_10625 [Brevundimonas sp.]
MAPRARQRPFAPTAAGALDTMTLLWSEPFGDRVRLADVLNTREITGEE